ncbi:hypothetical protein Scep_020092 [Stephania cephalantha]|uniref:Uncharacterized protein n=1 Tax=Stephania cephalantha TaxID=152367 RepID=A0AAP0IC41_9MAGN
MKKKKKEIRRDREKGSRERRDSGEEGRRLELRRARTTGWPDGGRQHRPAVMVARAVARGRSGQQRFLHGRQCSEAARSRQAAASSPRTATAAPDLTAAATIALGGGCDRVWQQRRRTWPAAIGSSWTASRRTTAPAATPASKQRLRRGSGSDRLRWRASAATQCGETA